MDNNSTKKLSKKRKRFPFLERAKSLLLEDIECPICKELMLGEVFMCVNGHNICHQCREKAGKKTLFEIT